MFLNLAQLSLIGLIGLFVAYLDWQGRLDVLKDKHPKLWRMVHNRPMRLTLLILCLVYLAKDFRDATIVAPPPTISIKTPIPPAIVDLTSVPEPYNSLRKEVLRLADAEESYDKQRKSEWAKASIRLNEQGFSPLTGSPDTQYRYNEAQKAFDKETFDRYMKSELRDRAVGVIGQLKNKGINVEYIRAFESQPAEAEFLELLRNAAYRLDARGDKIPSIPY